MAGRIGEKRKREKKEKNCSEVLGKTKFFFSATRAVMHGPSRKSLRAFPTVDNKSPHSHRPYCEGGVISC